MTRKQWRAALSVPLFAGLLLLMALAVPVCAVVDAIVEWRKKAPSLGGGKEG